MKVKIEQRHIDRAERLREVGNPPKYCPVALALRESTPGGYRRAYYSYAVVDGRVHDYSKSAKRFMRRFDKGLPVKPASFVLRKMGGNDE